MDVRRENGFAKYKRRIKAGAHMDKKNISISYIDDGQTFDWGKTSEDYAKYRDIYPEEYYVSIAVLERKTVSYIP